MFQGLPWTVAKGYDTFCPISRFIEKEEIPKPEDTTLWLKVDNQLRQQGSTKDMVFSYCRCPVVVGVSVAHHLVIGFPFWFRTLAPS